MADKTKNKRPKIRKYNFFNKLIDKFYSKLNFTDEDKISFRKNFRYWLFVLFISVTLSVFVITISNDIYAFVKDDKSISVQINAQDSPMQIANKLKDNDVIKHPLIFRLYSMRNNNDEKFKYGTYNLNSKMSYSSIVKTLKSRAGSNEIVKFTIPEGFEIRQIIDRLVEKELGTKEKFQDAIDNYDYKHEFVKNLKKGKNRLEGYLFPDTYEVYKDEGEVSIVKRMLDNFQKKVIEVNKIDNMSKDTGLSFNEIVILASIIEREGKAADELPIVSSVFHNRLNSKKYPKLQSCATVQYVMPERKSVITAEDIKIDSPYNTYQNKGLPPGPISNPGLNALKAAAAPKKTDYYFFVAKPDGKHIFSTTYEQHKRAIDKAKSQYGTGVFE